MPELKDFEGRWAVTRRIADHLGGVTGRFDGVAVLTPDGAGLHYEERGTLALGGAAPMAATRTYLWRPAPDGTVAVLFGDGRPFHGFDPAAAAPEATHFCDPDDYAVRYDFGAWPVWHAVWTVRGPRKDYRMESRYSRA